MEFLLLERGGNRGFVSSPLTKPRSDIANKGGIQTMGSFCEDFFTDNY